MRSGAKQTGSSGGRLACLVTGAVLAAASPAAGAELIVPHASAPHSVQLHVASAPAPAASSSGPVQGSAPAPSASSSAPVASSGVTASDFPGSEFPSQPGDKAFPKNQADPWGSGCGVNCGIHWSDWMRNRIQTLRAAGHSDDADELQDMLDVVSQQIRNDGGRVGAPATDEPTWEDGPAPPWYTAEREAAHGAVPSQGTQPDAAPEEGTGPTETVETEPTGGMEVGEFIAPAVTLINATNIMQGIRTGLGGLLRSAIPTLGSNGSSSPTKSTECSKFSVDDVPEMCTQ